MFPKLGIDCSSDPEGEEEPEEVEYDLNQEKPDKMVDNLNPTEDGEARDTHRAPDGANKTQKAEQHLMCFICFM